MKSIVTSNTTYTVIRYIPKLGIFIFLLGIILKANNRKLIIDVPTPMTNHINEILNNNNGIINRFFNIMIIGIQGFIPFVSAYKIIQYANESEWFSLFVKYKTVLIGNGVDVESIPIRKNTPCWPTQRFNFIAVGTVALWHGWDKIIDMIKELEDESFTDFEIHITIVGDGPDLNKLKKQTKINNLENNIHFTGFLNGQKLYNEYKNAHFGLGSFGWERIGVTIASPIKSREYLSAGIPFIYSTKDIDFNKDNKCAILIDDINFLKSFIKNLKYYKIQDSDSCRTFAKENLDFSIKVKQILDGL